MSRIRLLAVAALIVLTGGFCSLRAAEPLPPEKARPALLKLIDRPKVPAYVVAK